MKRFLIIFSLLFFTSTNVFAETSLSNLFIGITDMKSSIKDNDESKYKQYLQTFEQDYKALNNQDNKTNKRIIADIHTLKTNSKKDTRIKTLDHLSHELIHLEKILNPVDKNAKRKKLTNAITPLIEQMQSQIKARDYDAALNTNKTLNAAWTANEKVVREDDIGRYGQIETKLMMIRIALSKEKVDATNASLQIDKLQAELNQYIQGKQAKATKTQDASILSTHIEKAVEAIDNDNLEQAKSSLTSFISVWPNVEGEIRNSNASLYTQIETDIPKFAGSLNQDNKAHIKKQLLDLNKDIKQAISKTNYNFIDAALIMLREGVEALLIIMALISVTKKARQKKATRWIIVGGIIGLLLSVLLALSFNFFFKNVGEGRELLEAYIGIFAVIFMAIIGVWLHSKSSVQNWNNFINKNISEAISSGSIFTFALLSFLSVFREGAETIIFYAGIAGKISTVQLVAGIIIAIIILIVFALSFNTITKYIPIHKLFLIMSILIFMLAFKILGVSVHTFQVLNKIKNTTINFLPDIPSIGFYPTFETVIPQLILIIGVSIYLFSHYRQQNNSI